MNREEVLKQCCTSACIWDDEKACHEIKVKYKLTIDNIKFLSTIKVHTLDLWNNNIGDNGAKYLAENKTIHTLDLYLNNIGDIGAKYLADNKTIHTLGIQYNIIGDIGAKYLAKNKTIHALDLQHNFIGDNGAKYLAENKTIHTLNLRFNHIGDIGAKYFTKSIIPNLDLGDKYLDISVISRNNYLKYIDNIQDIVSKHILKDLTNIIINYIKND